jgi:hypothetical protein
VISISRRLKSDSIRNYRIIADNRAVVIPFGFISDELTAYRGGGKLVPTDRAAAAAIVIRAREFARRVYDEKRLTKDIQSLCLNLVERS